MKAKVAPNDMHPGRSFVCMDMPPRPYMDGMGRPLRDFDGCIKFQMAPALFDRDVPDELARALVDAWNAHPESTPYNRAPEHGEPKMLAKHFVTQTHGEPRIAKFYVHDRWREADTLLMLQRLLSKGLVLQAIWDMRTQAILYVATHPEFPRLKPDDEVPLRYLLWQGNRFVFGVESKSVVIESKTNAPDWFQFQEQYPDCEFRVIWPWKEGE